MKTTVYQFHPDRLKTLDPLPTYLEEEDVLVVYDPDIDYDRSGFFRLKYLYAHFPSPMKIKVIMTFPRVNTLSYYAIVYTEEKTQQKTYYFRHYMRGRRHRYRDFTKEVTDDSAYYWSLDWTPDDLIKYCDEIEQAPTSAVIVRDTEEYDKRRDTIVF